MYAYVSKDRLADSQRWTVQPYYWQRINSLWTVQSHAEFVSDSYFNNLYHVLSKYKLKVIKSYLGMANRDLKSLRKEFSGKKLSHFIRGVEFAHSLAADEDLFEFVLDYNKRMYLLEIKNNDVVNNDILETTAIYETRMNTLRAAVDSARVEKLSWEDAALINYIIEKLIILN